ncbi:EAL domain-containing protein [Methylovorus sp. MP688]|uniref:EAL domain-containing protein n=1 Tax=Methylovorus sp. (strain MP688) TaxID=887061 RepID=UPI0001EC4C81|nr:EAL domain-containing protein [Methylovorus sp. MP688]ADQ85130.1 diguanylate cyclase/phosphodiesterase [Methylovorus sp. MP688]
MRLAKFKYSGHAITAGFAMRMLIQSLLALVCISAAVYAVSAEQLESGGLPFASKPLTSDTLELTTQEFAWLKAHPVITVGVHHGWMPIEFLSEGNEFRGITVDYLKRFERLLGVRFQRSEYSENPATETADMLSGIASVKSLNGSRFVALPEPVISVPYTIYIHKKNDTIRTFADLQHKRVAVFKNGPLAGLLTKDQQGIELFKVDIAEEAFVALETGKADAYIGNPLVVDYVSNVQGIRYLAKAGSTPYKASVNMAVRKDWPELASILQKTLKHLEPERSDILNDWRLQPGSKTGLLPFLLAGLLLLATIIVLRGYRLKREVARQAAASQKLIWKQANYDFLTGLPNRPMFHKQLAEEIHKSLQHQQPLVLMFLDLDNFKQINDQLGHSIGDKLLVETGARIAAVARDCTLLARLGGDEFTIVLSNVQNQQQVEWLCERILRQVSLPFTIENHVVYVTTSIGIASFPEHSRDVETLMKYADQAMYEAKRLGRNRYQFFSPSMQELAAHKLQVSNDLRHALNRHELVMYYQPIVDLATNEIHKAEALVRWQHPTRGLVPPFEFIPVAEETGMINRMGDWVFRQSARDTVTLVQESLASRSVPPDGNVVDATIFQVSINVSPLQFQSSQELQTWQAYLDQIGLPAECLAIEITEGLLLEASDQVKATLTQFRDAGIATSIDDFGTGYSSLAYLKKFHIDFVKIDRSFVQNLGAGNDDMVLCEVIVDMAHRLGMRVIAEGVETEAQLELLKRAGCDFAQGYLFSPALPFDQFMTFVRDWRKAPAH